MDWIEAIGYVASALVLATFSMKTMLPLRYVAISSNVVFVIYGLLGAVYPVLVLHLILLPLNVYRLYEIRSLISKVREAANRDYNVNWMLPFMTSERRKPGDVVFRRGEVADRMYYVVSGKLHVEEFDVDIDEGRMVGEVGLFAPERKRMATVVCKTECELMSMTDKQVINMFHQDRRFSFYMVKLITARLIEDVRRYERASDDRPAGARAGAITD